MALGLRPAALDPTSHPRVTQVQAKLPQFCDISRKQRYTEASRCPLRVPGTVIFHTDTQKKCFIYILPSKEFEQQQRTY